MKQPTSSDDIPAEPVAEEPKPPTRLLLIFLIGAVAIVVLWAATRNAAVHLPQSNQAVGTYLRELQLEQLTGSGGELNVSDLPGHVTVINFWGTWCRPCLLEFPHLVEMNERFESHPDFQFVSVSCGAELARERREDLLAQTNAYLERSDFDITVYTDPGGTTRRNVLGQVGGGAFSYPTTLIVDRKGVIRAVWLGYREGVVEEMESAVKKLLWD